MRSKTLALVLLASFVAPAGPRAEWQVQRRGTAGQLLQASHALQARPDEPGLAARVIRLAGPRGAERLLADFGEHAAERGTDYRAVEAYAQLLLAARRWQEAEAQFAHAASLRPSAPEPLAGRARAFRGAGAPRDALLAYDRAIERETRPHGRRRLLTEQAELAAQVQDSDYEIAARKALAALEARPGTAEMLAAALERSGRPGEAALVLEPHLRDAGKRLRPEIALRAAALHEAAGADGRATDLLRLVATAPRLAPEQRRDAWHRRLQIARRTGALRDLETELARAPGGTEWEVLSQVREDLGDFDGALQAALRASGRRRPDADLSRRIINLLERLGRDDELTTEHEKLAAAAPHDPQPTLRLVEHLFATKKRTQAQLAFDRALSRFARRPAALAQLAESAARWSDDGRALTAWERMHRAAPSDEVAILALGEAYFQRGRKGDALRIWASLKRTRPGPVDGRLALAEVMMEHDLLGDAAAEVQAAQERASKDPRPRRSLALIYERQRRVEAAVREWEAVLAMSRGAAGAAERREARSRIFTLVASQGRSKLEDRVRQLEAEARANPTDREAALFLAEAQARSGNITGAIATLRRLGERARTGESSTSPDTEADVAFALARLLKQTRQPDEALAVLEEVADRAPDRAREAELQIAELELARHRDRSALDHAARAADLSARDSYSLLRIGEVQERAGDVEAAALTYRRGFELDSAPQPGLALARLLVRRGEPRPAADVLHAVLRSATDEDVITEAGRRLIELDEYHDALGDLEALVATLSYAPQKGTAYRRLQVELLRRMVPRLYRSGSIRDRQVLSKLAQHGLRPLLEIVTTPGADADRSIIELLGMLGNPDATPALARLGTALEGPSAGRSGSSIRSDVQLAAVIAMGRLADPRAREALEAACTSAEPTLRVAALWALGRLAAPEAHPILAQAAGEPRADVAGVALLGLGRQRGGDNVDLLSRAALDPKRPIEVRRAATVALGLAAGPNAAQHLVNLLEVGDPPLRQAAAIGIAMARDRQAVFALLRAGLFEPRPRTEDSSSPLAAGLNRLATGEALPDEARGIDGNRVDLDALLDELTRREVASDRTVLWLDRAPEITSQLRVALDGPRDVKLRALAALDARDRGIGVGMLAPTGAAPLPAHSARAARSIGEGVTDAVWALAHDLDPDIQPLAIRICAKLEDPRLTAEVLRELVRRDEAGPAVIEAVEFAIALAVEAKPANAAAVVSAFGPLLSSAAIDHRMAALGALRRVGPAARPFVTRALSDPSPLVRSAAVTVLAELGADGASLATAATDPSSAVRTAVARALQDRDDPAALRVRARLAQDPESCVRAAAQAPRPRADATP